MNYEALESQVHAFKSKIARGFSVSQADSEDLEQELNIQLLKVLTKYGDRPEEELIKVAKGSMLNRARRIYRQNKRRFETMKPTGEMPDTALTDSFRQISNRIAIAATIEILDDAEAEVLLAFLETPVELLTQARAAAEKSENRKKSGKLTMKAGRVQVLRSHLARYVNVSPATLSRMVNRIQETLLRTGYMPA